MTCQYAYDAGYERALEKVRNYINREHETIMTEKRLLNSDHTIWWRQTGQQDFILKFLDELSRLIGDRE